MDITSNSRPRPKNRCSLPTRSDAKTFSQSVTQLFITNTCFQLPNGAQDAIPNTCSPSQKSAIITHCHCELMQQVWKVIQDDDFKKVYEHGFVVECLDGIFKWFYPWIFTYSADYPEKCVLNSLHVAKYWFYHFTGFFWQVFGTKAFADALGALCWSPTLWHALAKLWFHTEPAI